MILSVFINYNNYIKGIVYTYVSRYDYSIIVLLSCRLALLPELGTANLHSIPETQVPQSCKRCSTTANAHCTSANSDHNIYWYFVLLKTFFIFGGQILPLTSKKKVITSRTLTPTQKIRAFTSSKQFYHETGNTVYCFANLR